jgi:hypothetical protein
MFSNKRRSWSASWWKTTHRAPLRRAALRSASQRAAPPRNAPHCNETFRINKMLNMPIPKQSKVTYAAYELLKEAPSRHDKTVVYSEFVDAAGKPISRIRGNICTAIKWARKTDGIVFENLIGVGYRVAKDADIAPIAQKGRERARRGLKASNEKLDCVDVKSLTPEQRASHDVEKSATELALLATRPRTVSNVKQMSIRKHNALDEQELLEAVKSALMKE